VKQCHVAWTNSKIAPELTRITFGATQHKQSIHPLPSVVMPPSTNPANHRRGEETPESSAMFVVRRIGGSQGLASVAGGQRRLHIALQLGRVVRAREMDAGEELPIHEAGGLLVAVTDEQANAIDNEAADAIAKAAARPGQGNCA
jgi:hypothetical protein